MLSPPGAGQGIASPHPPATHPNETAPASPRSLAARTKKTHSPGHSLTPPPKTFPSQITFVHPATSPPPLPIVLPHSSPRSSLSSRSTAPGRALPKRSARPPNPPPPLSVRLSLVVPPKSPSVIPLSSPAPLSTSASPPAFSPSGTPPSPDCAPGPPPQILSTC